MFIVNRSAEAKFVETLSNIRDNCDEWTAVVFHLNRLQEQYRSDYQLRIAINLANDLLASHEGGIFPFADGGMAVLCEHMGSVLTGKLIFQLRYLCMDDPLAYTDEGHENPEFCTVYRLGADWQKCMNDATRRMTLSGRGKEVSEEGGVPQRFSARVLARIERDLEHADLESAVRRQPVCAVTGTVRRVFDELYMHMPHLRQLLKADVDFLSNRWLFKYLTQLLDVRMLNMVSREPGRHLAQPVSININAETLLGGSFAEFDAGLLPVQKVGVVFEVPVADVFTDMAAYVYARDAVQRLGYRICLDGLTVQSFLHIDRERLKADILKLQWNADVKADVLSSENVQLKQAVSSAGAGRIILCRCDGKEAVEYGQAMGISLFQGRYLDGLINPQSKVNN